MKTKLYIKMDAYDQWLLSKGVCRQLAIIDYHPDVYPFKKVDIKEKFEKTSSSTTCSENIKKAEDDDIRMYVML